jgi:hypothetical protein
MKAKGSYQPTPFEYELDNNEVTLKFYTNIVKTTEMDMNDHEVTSWSFDRYVMVRPHDNGLISRIESDLPTWLSFAEAEEKKDVAKKVRHQRNDLLKDTDMTQLTDAPFSNEEKTAYRNYRQALRDVPQQPGFPYDVVFPALPSIG